MDRQKKLQENKKKENVTELDKEKLQENVKENVTKLNRELVELYPFL